MELYEVMNSEIIDLYTAVLNNLKNSIDPNFRNELLKEHQIESLDNRWKQARINIQQYIENVKNHHPQIDNVISYHGYFLYEDIAAIFLDLIWQDLHNKLDIKETIFYYKTYKIQICNRNLLTYPSN
jgi:hypothetical protein